MDLRRATPQPLTFKKHSKAYTAEKEEITLTFSSIFQRPSIK
jgi:hypothetical protein